MSSIPRKKSLVRHAKGDLLMSLKLRDVYAVPGERRRLERKFRVKLPDAPRRSMSSSEASDEASDVEVIEVEEEPLVKIASPETHLENPSPAKNNAPVEEFPLVYIID